jgi:hypothetical protein
MKKNTVFVVILLVIGMQIFADENLGELENINIGWQLFNNKADYTKLNILGLNPLFFYNGNYGLLGRSPFGLIPRSLLRKTWGAEDLFPRIRQDFKEKSSIPKSLLLGEQGIYKNSQENNWFGFLLVVAGYSIIWTDAYKNPLRYRYFEDAWERRQQIEKRMYKNITGNND